MATLSNYLSQPTGTRTRRNTSSSFPVIRRYNPYTTRRGSSQRATQSAFPSQDIASALLAQQTQRKLATPSFTFEQTQDYDPILARIQAISASTIANARTEAANLRKEAAIQSGDANIARELKLDDNTITAAEQNPAGELQQLQREYAARQKQLEDARNAEGLFYSGTYADDLSELARGRALAESSIGQRLRNMLAGIDTNLLEAEEAERQRILDQQAQEALMKFSGGTPYWNPETNSYEYPPGYDFTSIPDQGTSGGAVWFDMDGNLRTDPIPDG